MWVKTSRENTRKRYFGVHIRLRFNFFERLSLNKYEA
jgi:hypothetical protein